MSTNNEQLPMGVQMVGMSAMPMVGMAMGGLQPGVQMQAMPMPALMGMAGMTTMTPMVTCRVSCEMSADGMTVRLRAVDAQAMGLLKERCDALNALSAMSTPTTITCGPMPLLVCAPPQSR